jgi:predicted DCC family thiol-disulfide oxidoreductase YuxK
MGSTERTVPEPAIEPTDATALPDEPTVIFDGVCNLCNVAVSFLIGRDRDRVLRYTSNDSEAAAAILASVGGLQEGGSVDNDTAYLYHDGVLHERSDAVFATFGFLPWPWRLVALGRFLPRPLRNAGYRLVAANRYRLFGKKDTCRVPTPEERALFL